MLRNTLIFTLHSPNSIVCSQYLYNSKLKGRQYSSLARRKTHKFYTNINENSRFYPFIYQPFMNFSNYLLLSETKLWFSLSCLKYKTLQTSLPYLVLEPTTIKPYFILSTKLIFSQAFAVLVVRTRLYFHCHRSIPVA